MSRIAKILNLRPGILHAALARQEPPVQDGPREVFRPEDVFSLIAGEDFAENPLSLGTSDPRKVDNYNLDLTEEEFIAVQAFIETYRQIKLTSLKE